MSSLLINERVVSSRRCCCNDCNTLCLEKSNPLDIVQQKCPVWTNLEKINVHNL